MAQDKVAEIIKFTGAGEPAAPAQPVAPPAADEAEHAGAFLAAARAAAGLSVEAVSDAIKLKAAHVAAIEAMRADLLPATPYAVGFVRTYARFLHLDADAVAARFRAEIAGAAPPAAETAVRDAGPAAAPGNEGARLAWVFAIFAIVLFALWVIVQVLSGAGNAPPAPQPAVSVAAPQPQGASAVAEPAPEISAEDSQFTEDTAADGLGTAAEGETPPQETAGETAAEAAENEAAAIPETPAPAPAAAQETPRETPPAETAAQAATETAREAATETASAPQERPLPRRPRPAPPSRAPEVVEAALVRSPAPAYPERCTRAARDLESVTVMFDVSEAGRAVNARVVSTTNACFNGEALSALARWRFTPRTVDGAASIEAGKSATLNFRK